MPHTSCAIILNKKLKFYNINLNKLNIDETSGGFSKGNSGLFFLLDILGNPRTTPPDLGAIKLNHSPK
jgi:hypothetical protein